MSKQIFTRTPNSNNAIAEHHFIVLSSLVIPCGPGFNIGDLQDTDGHIYLKIMPDKAFIQCYANGQVYEFNQTGPQGPKGDKGDIGDTGPAGADGAPGPKGDTGLQGIKGDKGDTGPKGDTGERGPQGLDGPAGLKGDTGEQGPPGANGRTPVVYVQADDPSATNTVYPGDRWIMQ